MKHSAKKPHIAAEAASDRTDGLPVRLADGMYLGYRVFTVLPNGDSIRHDAIYTTRDDAMAALLAIGHAYPDGSFELWRTSEYYC